MIPTRGADTCTSSAQISIGKSTLLLNLIAQDLAAGQRLAVLDPHGDLAETVLLHVPRNRSNVVMPRQMNAIKSGRTVVGTTVTPDVDVSILADAGYDFLLLDTQH